MTSGKHKSKDNDAIFEAYAQQQLDERGGFWDKQLANSPVMKKLAGNMSARAQGRVDSKQTANQITQAFYQSLGRNKGNIDTDQFKAWMGQAVGVNPQYLQSLGNVTKPQMSHREIKKLIPDIVDQAITAKQSGQAAKPGVAGMSQNTQVATPQQQRTVAPPAGVTPPNPNSQPQQAAVNNPNTPQGQAQPVQPAPTPAVNNPNTSQGQTQPAPANIQPNPNTSTVPQNQNKPSLMSRIAGGVGKGVGNVVGGVAGGLAGGAIGGAIAGYNKGRNMMSGNKQAPSTQTQTSDQEKQTAEPPSMQDLTKDSAKNFQDYSNSTDKSNIDSEPVKPEPAAPPIDSNNVDSEPVEVDAEPIEPGTTEPTTGSDDSVDVPTVVDAEKPVAPTTAPELPNDQSSNVTSTNQQDTEKERQEIQTQLRDKGYKQEDIERWSDPNNGLSMDQIDKEMQDYQKARFTPPPPPELPDNSSTTTPPPEKAEDEEPPTQNQTQSNPLRQQTQNDVLADFQQQLDDAEDEDERAVIQMAMNNAKKNMNIQERINRGRPGFIWK